MHILLLVGVIAWHVGNFEFAASQVVSAQSKSLSDSLMSFTAKSFKIIAKNQDKNMIYSPLGAWTVLTMASFGASGTTRTQLRLALALPDDDLTTLRGVVSMIDNFSSLRDYELRSANKIFIADDIQLDSSFINSTRLVFGSSPWRIDFTNPDKASKIINKWAAGKTHDRIKHLIEPDTLDSGTGIVLVNAVHFKGSWAHQFPSESMELMPFYVRKDVTIDVLTMSMYEEFLYGDLPNAEASFVKIPYKVTGGKVGLSMYVILPNEIDGIPTLVKNFERDFEKLFHIREKSNVHLRLPRFTIESDIDLKDSLVQMGSDDMFGTAANFTFITNDGVPRVSEIAQKVFIDINAAGSEVVAAELRSAPLPTLRTWKTIDFVVDHPFVCVIATDNRIPLFTAIITEPDSTPI